MVFEQIERALPDLETPEEVAVLCRVVGGLLHDHGAEENDLTHLAVAHILIDHARQARLCHEHREMDRLLESVGAVKDVRKARSRLKAAFDACRAHFAEEERHMFPLIEKVLQPETLQVLGRARKLRA
jgi:hemerythrin-like domain-containing protein